MIRVNRNVFILTAVFSGVNCFALAVGVRADLVDSGYKGTFTATYTPPSAQGNPNAGVGGGLTGQNGQPAVFVIIQLANTSGRVNGEWTRTVTNSDASGWQVNVNSDASGILQSGSVSGAYCNSFGAASANGNLASSTGNTSAGFYYSDPETKQGSGSGTLVAAAVNLNASATYPNAYGYSTAGFNIIWAESDTVIALGQLTLQNKASALRHTMTRHLSRVLRVGKPRRIAKVVAKSGVS